MMNVVLPKRRRIWMAAIAGAIAVLVLLGPSVYRAASLRILSWQFGSSRYDSLSGRHSLRKSLEAYGGPAVREFSGYLDDSRPNVRAHAVAGLSNLPTCKDSRLADALGDNHPTVRLAAYAGLVTRGHTFCERDALDAASLDSDDPLALEFRRQIALALARRRVRRAVGLLVTTIEDEEFGGSCESLRALAALSGDPELLAAEKAGLPLWLSAQDGGIDRIRHWWRRESGRGSWRSADHGKSPFDE